MSKKDHVILIKDVRTSLFQLMLSLSSLLVATVEPHYLQTAVHRSIFLQTCFLIFYRRNTIELPS